MGGGFSTKKINVALAVPWQEDRVEVKCKPSTTLEELRRIAAEALFLHPQDIDHFRMNTELGELGHRRRLPASSLVQHLACENGTAYVDVVFNRVPKDKAGCCTSWAKAVSLPDELGHRCHRIHHTEHRAIKLGQLESLGRIVAAILETKEVRDPHRNNAKVVLQTPANSLLVTAGAERPELDGTYDTDRTQGYVNGCFVWTQRGGIHVLYRDAANQWAICGDLTGSAPGLRTATASTSHWPDKHEGEWEFYDSSKGNWEQGRDIKVELEANTALHNVDVNMYIINTEIVVPLSKVFYSSYVELVANAEQPPTVFVSHFWGNPFWQTLQLLEFHAKQRGWENDTAYWICTFANNQHDLQELCGRLEDTPFVKAIRLESCRGTVALLDSQISTFERIWCVLENAISTDDTSKASNKFYDLAAWLPDREQLFANKPVPSKATLQLDYGPDDLREVVEVMVDTEGMPCKDDGGTFPLKVAKLGVNINLVEAKASREEDKRAILHFVAGTAIEHQTDEPPTEHPNYDRLNLAARERFLPGTLYDLAQKDQEDLLADLLTKFPKAVNSTIQDGATALWVAAKEGSLACLKVLLAANANVSQARNDGLTPAISAASNNQAKALRDLLEHKADPNQAREEDGTTPLYLAAQKGQLESMHVLLEFGADVGLGRTDGWTPAATAAFNNQFEALKLLLDDKADANQATKDGSTPLLLAAGRGNLEALRVLLNAGANPNSAKRDGETPVLMAALKGQVKALKELLDGKADVNQAMQDGRTPLHLATENGQLQVLQMLLAAGADPGRVDNDDEAPCSHAAAQGYAKALRILLDGRADPDQANNNGQSLLHLAAASGMAEAIEVLLAAGADVGLVTKDGDSVLAAAAFGGHAEAVLMLLNAQADVNKVDENGDTALHHAAEGGHIEVLQLLLTSGADSGIRNFSDKTASDIATDNDREEALTLLLGDSDLDSSKTATFKKV